MELQPIETAPKDGTYILLFGDSGYTTTPLRAHVGHYDDKFRPRQPWVTHSDDSFLDDGTAPKWWAPLPESPDPLRGLRDDVMKELNPLVKKCRHWPGWPGTIVFADAMIRVLQQRGLV
jgi:hypothetical protein